MVNAKGKRRDYVELKEGRKLASFTEICPKGLIGDSLSFTGKS